MPLYNNPSSYPNSTYFRTATNTYATDAIAPTTDATIIMYPTER